MMNTLKEKQAKKGTTLQDVARAAGVSTATASLALNGKTCIKADTRAIVHRAAQELGYEANFYAQGLRKQGSDEIGLFSLDVDLGVGTRKMQLIQYGLHQRGHRVPLYGYGYNDAGEAGNQVALMNALLRTRPRAVICNTAGLRAEALNELTHYHETGGIVVCYDHAVQVPCDQIVFDRIENTRQATRHLLELGHRDIGFFLIGRRKPGGPKWEGFCRALQEADLPVRPEWMLSGDGTLEFEEEGVRAAQQFLQLTKRPTAMCIVNDNAALGFMCEIGRAGVRVPQDLSIVGHDNRAVAGCCPTPLTTIEHPMREIARQVVKLVAARLEGKVQGTQRIEVFGELIVRQSVIAKAQ